MYDRLEELQALLYKEIPITQHFHLSVGAYSQQLLRLDAPLAENVNHAGTAFGGSFKRSADARWMEYGLVFIAGVPSAR